MRKFLLILCVAFVTLGTNAVADKVVTFDFTNPTSVGLDEVKDYYLTANQAITVDGVTLTFNGTSAKSNRVYYSTVKATPGYEMRMYKSASANMTITAGEYFVKKVEAYCATYSTWTYDNGLSLACGQKENNLFPVTWTGDDSSVKFTCNAGNVFMKKLLVTIGEAPAIAYPKANINSGIVFKGFNNTITATCSTEGATISYSFDNATWSTLPAEGINLSESCTLYLKAEKDGQSSAISTNIYTVIDATPITKASELEASNDKDYVLVNADWTVVAYDSYGKYAFLGDNATKENMAVKVSSPLTPGDVIKGGWIAQLTKSGGYTYDRYITPVCGTLEVSGNATVTPLPVKVTTALNEKSYEYTLVTISKVSGVKTANYNFDLTDATGTIHAYDEFGIAMAVEEGKTYDVTGILLTTLDGRIIHPTAIVEHSDDVVFDFSDPTAFGYDAPTADTPTRLADGNTITKNGVVFTNVTTGYTSSFFGKMYHWTEFVNEGGQNALVIKNKTKVTIAAPEGATIRKITFKGSALSGTHTFDKGYYALLSDNEAEWTGDEAVVTLTNKDTLRFHTMIVTLGEASDVAYPEFSSTGDVLYDGFTTPKTITLTCATEGATIMYRMDPAADWAPVPAEGIQVNTTSVIWAKAVLDGKESAVVSANYIVTPVEAFDQVAKFEALADGSVAGTSAALTVIHHWKTPYYSMIYATDGERVLNINDEDGKVNQLEDGTIINAGILGSKKDNGYMNFKPSFQLILPETIVASGTTTTITPTKVNINDIVANPDLYYNRYLQIDKVTMTFTKTNNYTLTDTNNNTLALYDRFTVVPSNLEDKTYTVKGMIINNGTTVQIYPVSITESDPNGINNVSETTESSADRWQKTIKSGKIVITKGNRIYTTEGQLVK